MIKQKLIPRVDIVEWSSANGMDVTINERPHVAEGTHGRLYATIPVEIKGDGVLTSTFGNGRTPDEAIENLAVELSNKTLVCDAYTDRRIEFGPFVFSYYKQREMPKETK